MTELFLHLLNISIATSYMIIAVLLLRILLKKAPKNCICILWGLVGLRLALPFNIESIFSLIPSGETFTPTVFSEKTSGLIIDTGFEGVNSVVNPITEAYVENTKTPLEQLVLIASIIWLTVSFFMLLFGLISFFRLKFKLRFSVRSEDGYFRSEAVKSPFILGIIKPKIYLPFNLNHSDEDYITKHEKAHISRMDHITKLFAFVLLTVYWFNPLVWIYYLTLQKDIESACDQRVIKNMKTEEKQLYSITLLKHSTNPKLHALTPIAFGEISVKQRIKSVINYKKPTTWLITVFVLIIIITILGFMTTPVKKDTADVKTSSLTNQAPTSPNATNKNTDSKYNELIDAIENGTYSQSLSEFEALLGGTAINSRSELDKSSAQNNSESTDTEGTPLPAEVIDSKTKVKRINIDNSNWKNYYEIVYRSLKQTNEDGKTITIKAPHYIKLKDGYYLAPDYGERKTTARMSYKYIRKFYYCKYDKNGKITSLLEPLDVSRGFSRYTQTLNNYINSFLLESEIHSFENGKATAVILSDLEIENFTGVLYLLDK